MGISQALFFIVQFAGSVIIARLLTPLEMGVYGVAMAVLGILSTVQAFGLASFIVREPDLSEEAVRSAFTINLLLSIAISGAVLILSVVGGIFLHEERVRGVLAWLSLYPLIGVFEFLPAARLERAADFRSIAAISSARTIVSQVLSVVLALAGLSFYSLVYGQITAALLSAILFNVMGAQHIRYKLGLSDWRRISNFGAQMLSINGINALSERAGEFALGRIVGLPAVGLYFRASNLANLIWENVHLVTGRVLFVDLSNIHKRGESLRPSYLRIVDLNTVLLWPCLIGLAVVSGPFILAVYGPRWVSAAHPLAMLAVALTLYIARPMTWELFVITGRTALQARMEILRASATFGFFLIGCFSYGLTGAAASRIAAAIFANALYHRHVDNMTDTRVADCWPLYLRNSLLSALAVGPSLILMWRHGFSEMTPLLLVVLSVAAGAAMWLMSIFLLHHPLAEEIRGLSRRILLKTQLSRVKD